MLQDGGFTDVVIGAAVDTFGGAKGEANASDVYGYVFMATSTTLIMRAGAELYLRHVVQDR